MSDYLSAIAVVRSAFAVGVGYGLPLFPIHFTLANNGHYCRVESDLVKEVDHDAGNVANAE